MNFNKTCLTFIIFLAICCILSSCRVKRKVAFEPKNKVQQKNNNNLNTNIKNEKDNKSKILPSDIVSQYINKYKYWAINDMENFGIPASITLAQGILESQIGRSRLAKEGNNHFGIKCHEWDGKKIYHDDDMTNECFRKYNSIKDSYIDHALFLRDRKRYQELFRLSTLDYKGWAKGLKRAGYATDTKYPKKLIDLIERYKLYRYDREMTNNKKRDQMKKFIVVKKGDTLYSLSKLYNIPVERIKNINGLSNNILYTGQKLYLK